MRNDSQEASRRCRTPLRARSAEFENVFLGANIGLDAIPLRQNLSARNRLRVEIERFSQNRCLDSGSYDSRRSDGRFRRIERRYLRRCLGIVVRPIFGLIRDLI
ncbi:MAG: hypothetical protein WAK63_05195 [Xanthobacteraceae bacterium]